LTKGSPRHIVRIRAEKLNMRWSLRVCRRTPEEGVNRLKAIDSLTVEIDFLILVYGRNS
jgi:hypothetical protein